MSRPLEARVAKLEEQITKREDALVVIIVFVTMPAGELYGYRNAPYGMEPLETIRQPGESEAELLTRAKSSARTVGGVFAFHELRR